MGESKRPLLNRRRREVESRIDTVGGDLTERIGAVEANLTGRIDHIEANLGAISQQLEGSRAALDRLHRQSVDVADVQSQLAQVTNAMERLELHVNHLINGPNNLDTVSSDLDLVQTHTKQTLESVDALKSSLFSPPDIGAEAQMRTLAKSLDEPIVVYDVGARWGVSSTWEALGPDVRLIGFEPDKDECERLNAAAPDNVTYVPVALGQNQETAVLHVTQEPACSSVYPPRTELIPLNKEFEDNREVASFDVDLVPLDMWIAKNAMESPDVLKLDTQGSELDILRGAEHALASTELVQIEVEFNPLYEGQPLFFEVDGYLRQAGFELWRLAQMVHYSVDGSKRQWHTGLQVFFDSVLTSSTSGSGQLFWAEAYYARADLCIAGLESLDPLRATRVGIASLGLGLNDLAAQVLSRSQN